MTAGNYLTAAAILLSVLVNVALLAYAWGTLRQIVQDLKDVVVDLRRTVDAIFPRLNANENRTARAPSGRGFVVSRQHRSTRRGTPVMTMKQKLSALFALLLVLLTVGVTVYTTGSDGYVTVNSTKYQNATPAMLNAVSLLGTANLLYEAGTGVYKAAK